MHQPNHHSPARRRLAGAALASLALVGCSGASPDTSPPPAAVAYDDGPAATDAATSLAPSGDPELDLLDAELAAFEEESRGLDLAVAAAEGE